jgi:zinc transporter ZupT
VIKVKSMIGWLKFAVIGGSLGGLIAMVGYWALAPSVDSVPLFVALRVLAGAVVAMVVGPIIVARHTKDKTDLKPGTFGPGADDQELH